MRRFYFGKIAALMCGLAMLMCLGGMECLADTQPAGAGQAGVPAPTEFIHILSCALDAEGQVAIDARAEGAWSDPSYYDNWLYLFEKKPYQDGLEGRNDYCGVVAKGEDISFRIPVNLGSVEDRLYSSFVVAVYDGQKYTPVSNVAYITNPESIARHKEAYQNAQNKKGLLIQTSDAMVADAFELGVKHVIVNIAFEQLLGTGVDYEYDGVTYHFNKSLLDNYDSVIRRMSEKNMTVTAVLLNGWNEATPQLYYPGVTRQSNAMYYGFNASTKEGYETIKAISSFLAQRYGSAASPYGKVSNWVIGNEVNNQFWNYMGPLELDQYVKEYERAFRVFYTAIKSTNQNDRVFFSTEFYWNSVFPGGAYAYKAKDFLDRFAEQVRAGGDIKWGLAYHPYPMPLTEPEFWDDGQSGMITDDVSTPILNLCNLHVLTDYMQTGPMRQADGNVRHIILSEQGFTSTSATRGQVDDIQAAAIAYAYYLIDSNPYIDAFIMSRQVDAPTEAADSQTFGLWRCDMNRTDDIIPTMRKKSWQVYKNIDIRSRTLETTEFAKSILGISKWSEIIPNFKWKSSEK